MPPTPHRPQQAQRRLPAADAGLLLVIAAVVAAAFLPWTRTTSLAGVSLLAWTFWGLMLAAPVAGAVLAARADEE